MCAQDLIYVDNHTMFVKFLTGAYEIARRLLVFLIAKMEGNTVIAPLLYTRSKPDISNMIWISFTMICMVVGQAFASFFPNNDYTSQMFMMLDLKAGCWMDRIIHVVGSTCCCTLSKGDAARTLERSASVPRHIHFIMCCHSISLILVGATYFFGLNLGPSRRSVQLELEKWHAQPNEHKQRRLWKPCWDG